MYEKDICRESPSPTNMWAYVDESGCFGVKIGSGSSPFFGVSAVVFNNKPQAIACYNKIEELKETLRIKKEFKFSRASHEQRVRFFLEMKRFQFNYFSLIIDKAQISKFDRPFLHLAVLTMFAAQGDAISECKVVIDKTGSSEFRKMMASRLKRDLNRQFDRCFIQEVKSVESHAHNLLQLADMVCGAVARSFHPDRAGPHTYREIIRKKEWQVSLLP